MTRVKYSRTGPATGRTGSRYWRNKSDYLGVVPFLLFTGLFLLYPTLNVVTGAFRNEKNELSTEMLFQLFHSDITRRTFMNTVEISVKTALIGAILGGLFAWALATGKTSGLFYRFSVALSSVLALFGGIMLAFAFLATFGFNGLVTTFAIKYLPNTFFAEPSWLYEMNGMIVVYTFFQIPLMVLVFLPTIENLRAQWREASDSLGGNALEYWMRIGIPVLTPSFVGATLLLFVNAFSAFATAFALTNLSDFLIPLAIGSALSNEIGGANPTEAKALALYMIIVVMIVMTLYALLRRRVSKWEQTR